ncbi:fatty acid hydroxylase [Pseudooceanicola batsensis HTCC2597]|uniref:Fatty acid hydroxylase n=1 Tax=Pseudooceanicola batsensis (strain ATCC BAA-863 / DSM 15984 / KCTC 12145 / HTCC2597) TaxID=252305 RepID=A3TW03_PSEBH|nr:sterol desaturase family protein [Pseudooceanicola batsensis]EAQ03799.1 fatty acid hydroxylase [Pseudooceanicola batsensis HTCC2597]
MIPALRIVIHMGGLHRLFPFWLAGLFALATWFSPVLLVALVYGVVLQWINEYLIHRFIYHREPPSDQSPFNRLYRSHIGHHEFPQDEEFFTGDDHWFPLKVAAGSFVLHLLALWPLLGLASAALLSWVAIFVGSASAFAFYEYCHTLAHLNVPKGRFGKRLTRSHMAHHYQDHEATYHVTFGMGWIDRLFGTAHDPARARARYDRRTMMSIGMDPEDLRLVTARKAYGINRSPRHMS